jgi:hypothetical protein
MKLRSELNRRKLRQQNREFANSGGVSAGNRKQGFIPAFCNTGSGRCVRSRFADGTPAPVHTLDGLPTKWIKQRDAEGHVTATIATVIAGFLRNGRFYTREEAASAS